MSLILFINYMGKKTITKCIEFLSNLQRNGYKKLEHYELMSLIREFIGEDPRSVLRAFDIMLDNVLIKEIKGGYKICLTNNT